MPLWGGSNFFLFGKRDGCTGAKERPAKKQQLCA